jgi:hypothetical protein
MLSQHIRGGGDGSTGRGFRCSDIGEVGRETAEQPQMISPVDGRVPRRDFIPHARGTLAIAISELAVFRFIPACAGNAPREPPACPRSPVHPPHAHPRMRGNATHARRQWQSTTVHPRMRGERGCQSSHLWLQNGSSPHARGTRSTIDHRHVVARFIPACAGNALPGTH